MKSKLILLATALTLFLIKVHAQSFSLQTTTGIPLNYGDTLVVSGTTNDFELESPLAVINNSTSLKTVMVERTLLSIVTGTDNAFAWSFYMYAPSINVSPFGSDINAGATDSSFYTWYFFNGIPGVSYVKYKFYDDANPADSAWMVFQFNVVQVAGIAYQQNNISQKVYPNPSGGVFNIDETATYNTTITARVYNVQGELVFTKSFSAAAGSLIDLSAQPAGNYFMKLLDDENKVFKTTELIKN